MSERIQTFLTYLREAAPRYKWEVSERGFITARENPAAGGAGYGIDHVVAIHRYGFPYEEYYMVGLSREELSQVLEASFSDRPEHKPLRTLILKSIGVDG